MLFHSAISKYILSHVFQFFCLSTGFCSTIDAPSFPKTALDFFEIALNKSEDEQDRKTAALKCLEKLSEDRNIIKNVTKHVLKHMVTAAELKAPERPDVSDQLTSSILCWLSYAGKDELIKTVRQLLSDLYSTGNDVMKIHRFVSGDNSGYREVKSSIIKLKRFANALKKNEEQIFNEDNKDILHTYNEDENSSETDNYKLDSAVFSKFKTAIDEINEKEVSDGRNEDMTQKLETLMQSQKDLFNRVQMMTKRIVEECFEPCIKMLIQDLFVIKGVDQYKNVSISADTPQPNVDLVSSLQFNIDVQNIESPILTLNLGREFTEAKDFTKFVVLLQKVKLISLIVQPMT